MAYASQKQSRGCLFWVGIGVVILLVGYAFRQELGYLLDVGKLLWQSLGGGGAHFAPDAKMLSALIYLGANLAGAVLLLLLLVALLSQVILPAPSGASRLQLARRIISFLSGFRPPVVFVKVGKLVKELGHPGQVRGGLVITDLSSAVALEKQWLPLALNTGGITGSSGLQRFPGRVGKPGVVFVGFNERLRGVVSLRKQFRINLNVRAYTSDGIEVECHVFAIFSLGQPPTVHKIAYIGEMLPQNLRLIQIDEETRKIKAISDELAADDQEEIHQYAQGFMTSNELPAPLEPAERGREYPPYEVDEERILSAVFSQARRVGESSQVNWSDLPALVATEIFRNSISQVAYDDIYLPKDPAFLPLQQEIKPKFARKVKALGVMSYQFMHRMDGLPIEIGQRVDFRQFRISAVQPFRTSRILRDRGIKVIHASFTELRPTDPAIRQQRLDNWRAHWQKEADITRADQDREVMLILSRARAEKQREMIASLSQIIQSSTYSEEALVLRVFQALEDITTDPAARRILPRDTINLLRNLRIWLLPEGGSAPGLLLEQNHPILSAGSVPSTGTEDGEVEDER
jgi:hypothetical protein